MRRNLLYYLASALLIAVLFWLGVTVRGCVEERDEPAPVEPATVDPHDHRREARR